VPKAERALSRSNNIRKRMGLQAESIDEIFRARGNEATLNAVRCDERSGCGARFKA